MKLGRYKHYKGEFYYDVFGFACNSDTDEKTVLYRPLYDIPELKAEYGDDIVFVRDLKIFASTVTIDGKEVPRFQLIEAA
jgi:hypothetical protein